MTINDLDLTKELVTIHQESGDLDRLTREGQEKLLAIALEKIEKASASAKAIVYQRIFSKLYP